VGERRSLGYRYTLTTEGDPGIPGKWIWKKKCGRRALGAAGGRWRWQHKTELDEDKSAKAHAPPGTRRHKSNEVLDKAPSFC